MDKNKGDAGNIAGIADLDKKLPMNKFNTPQHKIQHNSRRELLEQTKISRLPERKFHLPDFDNAPMKTVAVVAVCAGCNGRLDADDAIQVSVKVCRRCLTQYARIDSAIDDASKRKRREMLEKFAPEVNER